MLAPCRLPARNRSSTANQRSGVQLRKETRREDCGERVPAGGLVATVPQPKVGGRTNGCVIIYRNLASSDCSGQSAERNWGEADQRSPPGLAANRQTGMLGIAAIIAVWLAYEY